MRRTLYASLVIFLIFITTSCSNTKYLEGNQLLLIKNKVVFKKSSDSLSTAKASISHQSDIEDALVTLEKQAPTKNSLIFRRSGSAIYNYYSQGKITKFKQFMKDKIGSPPAILDSTLMKQSVSQMQLYMVNRGYFHASVIPVVTIKKKKAIVTYVVVPATQFTVGQYNFPPDTNTVNRIISSHKNDALLTMGDPLDLDLLDNERDRVRVSLENNGYYYFPKELLYFNVDTVRIRNQGQLGLVVANTTNLQSVKQFYFRNINIYSNFGPLKDTAKYSQSESLEKGTYFLYDTLFVRSSSLQNHIFIKQGDLFSKEKFDLTLNNLTQLGPYKFVNAKLKPVGDSTFDASFFLYPDKRYEVGYNLGLYTEESNVGTEPSVTFSDKNLSKSANQLQFSLSAGIAVPVYNIDSVFYQFHAQISLLIPKIEGLPVSLQRLFSKNSLPHTRLTLSADYQNQVHLYSLTSFNTSYGFEWRENATTQHVINPINISVVIPELSPKFKAYVDSNEILKQSFRHEFITGFQYSFINNSSKSYTDRTFHSLRFDAEISGPVLYGFIKLTNIFGYAKAVDDTSSAGFELSRFLRFDLDYRKYFKVTQTSDFAFRLYGGIAINILNDPAIPYIRQFYIGGASDLRAWPVRAFGPGASITPYDTSGNNASLFYDQTADIKLEANAEFRFGIISLLKGALFVDAGNIWNRTPNPAQPSGEFNFNTFYKQIAVGSGFGLRLDFTFFVMRFDFAFPTYNPVLLPANRWVIKEVIRTFSPFYSNWRSQYMVFNVAIGYPF